MKNMKKEHLKLKDLPVGMMPFEKYKAFGAGALTDDELIALIIRTGTKNLRVTEVARNLISVCEHYGGLSYLNRIPDSEIYSVEGIGEVKLAQLRCVAELSERMSRGNKETPFRQHLTSAEEVGRYLTSQMGSLEHEETWALYVDARNVLIKRTVLTSGTVNASLVSARDVFLEALRCSAVGVVLAHNHPSGDPSPSMDDIEVTRSICMAAQLMDVRLIDHIVVGAKQFISMKACGYIPE